MTEEHKIGAMGVDSTGETLGSIPRKGRGESTIAARAMAQASEDRKTDPEIGYMADEPGPCIRQGRQPNMAQVHAAAVIGQRKAAIASGAAMCHTCPRIGSCPTHSPDAEDLKERCFEMREDIEVVKGRLMGLITNHPAAGAIFARRTSETRENLILSYRLLEDAFMRLGKVVQALDGGKSVYKR